MACDTPLDAFRYTTESLSNSIYRHPTFQNNVWMNLIRKGRYPWGVGHVRSTFNILNQDPIDDDPTWETITAPGAGAPGDNVHSCTNTWVDSTWGYLEKTYGPERRQFRSPLVCRDQLMFNHAFETFLRNHLEVTTKNVVEQISNRYEAIYRSMCRKAVIESTGLTIVDQAGYTSLNDSTCALTLDALDKVAQELIYGGANVPDGKGFMSVGENGPLFSLLIGLEAKHFLPRGGSDINQREDYRYAESSELMKRLGATSTLRNFRMVPWIMPRRYNRVVGDYVAVNRHVATATSTEGTGTEINPAWKSAAYESCIVLHPEVFESEIVPPVMNAAGLSWDPETHLGTWKWITGGVNVTATDCYDPLHNFGRHFAEFYHAPKPLAGDMRFGIEIIYPRTCLNQFTCETCA